MFKAALINICMTVVTHSDKPAKDRVSSSHQLYQAKHSNCFGFYGPRLYYFGSLLQPSSASFTATADSCFHAPINPPYTTVPKLRQC